MDASPLLREKVSRCDAVLMTARSLGQQQYIGTVEEVYSRRFEGPARYDAGPLSFVGSTSAWGNVPLADGERALVFINYLPHSGRYYQDHWHGHFSLLERAGQLSAVANWHLLLPEQQSWGPAYLREAAFLLDENKPGKVAMPFALLEKHLLDELGKLPA
jgi:hypothetical protein